MENSVQNNINTKIEEESLYNQMGSNSENQYVTFTIGKEEYGVKILSVQEIISLPEITPIPNTPIFVKGVINLRGNIIPLIDLRLKFHMEEKALTKNSVIIVLNIEEENDQQKTVGVIVDMVSDVLNFEENSFQEIPSFSTNIKTEFIDKIGKIGDRLVILINHNRLFSSEELSELAKI